MRHLKFNNILKLYIYLQFLLFLTFFLEEISKIILTIIYISEPISD